jgi:hypothetical protein
MDRALAGCHSDGALTMQLAFVFADVRTVKSPICVYQEEQ